MSDNPFLQFEECPTCHHMVPKMIIFSVRGRSACLHCHLDWVWDYMEGTRRMIEYGKDTGDINVPDQRKVVVIPEISEVPRFDFPQ